MKFAWCPWNSFFREFPRVVRDVRGSAARMSRSSSRAKILIDKSILDTIAEPLTHLVRNAVGHGIEKHGDADCCRQACTGTIRLNAYHQANQVIVESRDDGHRSDVERVRAKAVEQGLISSAEAARLTKPKCCVSSSSQD
jgi:two-component system chemotaxis sensor kinase CheA